jgi:hypothetical protein
MFTFFTKIQQPDIQFWGTRIQEPITTVTGLFMAATCAWCCWQLRERRIRDRPAQYMYLFLVTLGLSSLLGAFLGHAFLYKLGRVWKIPGWELSMIAAFLLSQASMLRFFGENGDSRRYRALTWANGLALFICTLLTVRTLEFVWTEVYMAIGLLLFMSNFEYRLHKKAANSVSVLLLKGMVPMLVSVVLIIVKFSVSPWFNYFDISHLFVCATIVYFYRALVEQMEEGAVRMVEVGS